MVVKGNNLAQRLSMIQHDRLAIGHCSNRQSRKVKSQFENALFMVITIIVSKGSDW